MPLKVEPIDATLGARVTGVDLSSLDEATFDALYALLLEYGVLVFPAQHLSDDLGARISDLDESLTERVTTLGETMLSRHALGESLLALGAQLLGADKDGASDLEDSPPKADTGKAAEPSPAPGKDRRSPPA